MEQKFKRGETLGLLYTVDSSENVNLIQNSSLNIHEPCFPPKCLSHS